MEALRENKVVIVFVFAVFAAVVNFLPIPARLEWPAFAALMASVSCLLVFVFDLDNRMRFFWRRKGPASGNDLRDEAAVGAHLIDLDAPHMDPF